MGIKFREHSDPSYVGRTKENASAHATIAIAANFNSAGEKLTKKLVEEQGNIYIPIDISKGLIITDELVQFVIKKLNSARKGNLLDSTITLNIAGNGIYTLKNQYTQEQLDLYTLNILSEVLTNPNIRIEISLLRTGGQTGLDESGAKAGLKLGIDTLIVCPKGWKYRDLSGTDIADEIKFKNRFI